MSKTSTIEGRDYNLDRIDRSAIEYLRERITKLPEQKRAQYSKLLQQARDEGRSFSMSEHQSHRRFEIARGLILLLEDDQYDDGLVIGLCSDITSKQYSKPGEALANLHSKQAEAFARACQRIKAGSIQLVYNPKTDNTHMKENSNV
jgi:hypothetical protein